MFDELDVLADLDVMALILPNDYYSTSSRRLPPRLKVLQGGAATTGTSRSRKRTVKQQRDLFSAAKTIERWTGCNLLPVPLKLTQQPTVSDALAPFRGATLPAKLEQYDLLKSLAGTAPAAVRQQALREIDLALGLMSQLLDHDLGLVAIPIFGEIQKRLRHLPVPTADPAREFIANLKSAEGGAANRAEAAALLGVSIATVHNRREARKLVAWPNGANRHHYPRWQFTPEGRILPGVEECLQALRPGDEWADMRFFLSPSNIDGLRPLDLLRAGRREEALELALSTGPEKPAE